MPIRTSASPAWPSLVAQRVKRLPTMQETRVRSLCWEDPLEKEMATHSSILAWKIPWTEELGWLLSMGSQWGHDWATSLSLSLSLLVHEKTDVQTFLETKDNVDFLYISDELSFWLLGPKTKGVLTFRKVTQRDYLNGWYSSQLSSSHTHTHTHTHPAY